MATSRLEYLRNCTQEEREDEGTQAEYEELEKQESGFDQFQQLVLESYDEGGHAALTSEGVENCGDGLLRFLLVELSENEDCDSLECAVQRLGTAIDQLYLVKTAFEAKLHGE